MTPTTFGVKNLPILPIQPRRPAANRSSPRRGTLLDDRQTVRSEHDEREQHATAGPPGWVAVATVACRKVKPPERSSVFWKNVTRASGASCRPHGNEATIISAGP